MRGNLKLLTLTRFLLGNGYKLMKPVSDTSTHYLMCTGES